MTDVLKEFLQKFHIDDRASRSFERCSPDVQLKILSTFNPHQQSDTQDYSRKLMGYIRSLSSGEDMPAPLDGSGQGTKRSREEMEEVPLEALAGTLLASQADPLAIGLAMGMSGDESDLLAFRLRFPMDDRAYEFLANSPSAVRTKVMTDFNPLSSNDSDYSGLVTSVVRKARAEMQGGGAGGGFVEATAGLRASPEALEEFRRRFPMDERAWDFLSNSSGATQLRVITEFRPRREDDTDYSAAVTAFVRASGARGGGGHDGGGGGKGGGGGGGGPSAVELEAFRRKFPVDDRAFEFLANSPGAVQAEAMQSFAPRNMQDSDYSRPLTTYLKQLRDRCGGDRPSYNAAHGRSPMDHHGGGGGHGGHGGKGGKGGHGGGGGRAPPAGGGSRGGAAGWVQAFRTCYPMDSRALEFLESCSREVQDAVVAEFRPKRAGEDDYSAAVTSFVRRVKSRLEAGPPGVRLVENRGDRMLQNLLEAFRQRYPMDARAWDFLSSSPVTTQKAVLERFKPQREGERDYSRLITSFIRTSRD